MTRLYFLANDLDSAERIVLGLQHEEIADWQCHVLSKDGKGLYRRHIHSANFIHELELIRYAERGAIVGFLVALACSAYLIIAEPFGSATSGLVYAAIFGFITLFGAWIGGLTGIATENQHIAAHWGDIEAGRSLLLIDLPAADALRIQQLLAQRHPEARYLRTEPTVTNPFKLGAAAPWDGGLPTGAGRGSAKSRGVKPKL